MHGSAVVEVVPLGRVAGGEARLLVVRVDAGHLGARLVVDEGGQLRPAQAGDGAVAALVARWRAGDLGPLLVDWRGDDLVPGDTEVAAGTGGVAADVGGSPADTEVQVSTDHANRSLAVGDDLVKLLTASAPGRSRGVRLAEHLHAVGFDGIPAPLGTIAVDDGGASTVVAVASRYLPGGQEGWARFRDLVLGVVDGRLDVGATLPQVAALGGLVARFHVAVATPSDVIPAPTHQVDARALRGWHDRGRDRVVAAVDAVRGADGTSWLAPYAARLEDRLATLDEVDGALVAHVHGDLHVGQVLHVAGRDVLTDLDGPPEPGAGPPLDAPARDVAAVLRSLDHVGRLADLRSDGRAPDRIAGWITEARRTASDAYRAELRAAGRTELFDDRLLVPFEAEQACHEVVYAADHLPAWEPVARTAMLALVTVEPSDGP